jgi:RNA polymerase sigma factor (sigma-70 family)
MGVVSAEQLDDASLMQMIALNQVDALSVLYDRYGRLLYSIAFNTIGDQAAAEEVVQDVFTQVWKKANTYDAGIAKVSTWLISITRNRAIDELRRGKNRPEKTSVSWDDLSPGDHPQSPGAEEEMDLSWQQSSIRAALETISRDQREALSLAYFKGYSQSEIAVLLGLPLGTVKTRIRLAMQKLRLVLSETMMEESQPTSHY